MVKFAHMSDVHLGSWNSHPDLREYPLRAWEAAVTKCIEERVDFVVISGDFFDTSLPPVDALRKAAMEMRRLKESGIRVYAIAGSHDFSPTGKSMLNVLEDAGLLTNVAKMREEQGKVFLDFTADKSGVKLCGIIGRRGALERGYFENLDSGIEKEGGQKIFVFHSGVAELSGNFGGVPLSLLPSGFDYYASGHIHSASYDARTRVAFPGPLFPADFTELENYDSGFYIVSMGKDIEVRRVPVKLCGVCILRINADGKTPQQIQDEVEGAVEKENLEGKILLLKIEGVIDGRTTDINVKHAVALAVEKGAVSVKKSMKISTKEFEETAAKEHASVEEMERYIISSNAEKMKLPWLDAAGTERLIANLMSALMEERQEDESEKAYTERMKTAGRKVVGFDDEREETTLAPAEKIPEF